VRVAILGVQVPFARGGAERLVEELRHEVETAGHEADVITLPFNDVTRTALLASCAAWRALELRELHDAPVDRVIATKFPSYLVSHPAKVVWLIHQYRGAYDFAGTSYTNLQPDRVTDRAAQDAIVAMDRRALAECRAVFTISPTVSARLRRFNGIESRPLHPPARLVDRMGEPRQGDFVLAVSRLERNKRLDLLIEAMARTRTGVSCVIAGVGSQSEHLRFLVAEHGVESRVRFAGAVSDDELVRLYGECRAVFFAPFEEDYGYVTLEAFGAAKPVVTARDSGGVLEFVEDGITGLVTAPQPADVAAALDRLAEDPDLASRLGAAGRERTRTIRWDGIVAALLGG
jgi:glycosyltransferase involved in cell wall biosynthesis